MAAPPDPFDRFDTFRRALDSLPAGLVRLGPPASEEAMRAAEESLGRAIPAAYSSLLRSFDGADLFHETLLLAGVGPDCAASLLLANRPPRPPGARASDLVFAESSGGDRYLLPADDDPASGRVFRIRADSDERWLSGSSLVRWLEAVIARERVLYDQDGEFLLEAFEPDGEELTPLYALKQAERACKRDAGSADARHALGLALRRLGRMDQAANAFAEAADLDPANPWPWFDLGRIELSLGRPVPAADSFQRAAEALPGREGARFWVWAARAASLAGHRGQVESARAQALRLNPEILADLRRAAESARSGPDESARREAEELLGLFDPAHRLRLAVVASTADQSTPPPGPRSRPARGPARGPSPVPVREAPARPPRPSPRPRPRPGKPRRS